MASVIVCRLVRPSVVRWYLPHSRWTQNFQLSTRSLPQQAHLVCSMADAGLQNVIQNVVKRKAEGVADKGGAKRAAPGSILVNPKRVRELKAGTVNPGPVLYWYLPLPPLLTRLILCRVCRDWGRYVNRWCKL